MFVRDRKANCPDEFPFPFKPYTIQDQFMRALYSAIETRKIGIFESPTGTGKTLSVMCSVLKWLSDHDELNRIDLREQIRHLELEIKASDAQNAKTLDWLDGQYDTLQKKQKLNQLKDVLNAMDEFDKRTNEMRSKWQKRQLDGKSSRKFVHSKATKSGELFDNDSNETENNENVESGDGDEYLIEDVDDKDDDEVIDEDDANQKRYNDTKVLILLYVLPKGAFNIFFCFSDFLLQSNTFTVVTSGKRAEKDHLRQIYSHRSIGFSATILHKLRGTSAQIECDDQRTLPGNEKR